MLREFYLNTGKMKSVAGICLTELPSLKFHKRIPFEASS